MRERQKEDKSRNNKETKNYTWKKNVEWKTEIFLNQTRRGEREENKKMKGKKEEKRKVKEKIIMKETER